MEKETKIQQLVNHYFGTLGLEDVKEQAKNGKIKYSRHVKAAKQLLVLTDGDVEKAKEAIDKVAEWANLNCSDYIIETVIKKWLEIDQL